MEKLHQHKATLGISKIKHGSKHTKIVLENARYNSPVDLTYMNLNTSVKPVRQSWQQEKSNHRLIRRIGLNNVGSTVDATPDDPTKSNSSVGAVVQRGNKTNPAEHRMNQQ